MEVLTLRQMICILQDNISPMPFVKLSKLDVAKRELEYSARLFFLGGDPVIIHLIASAAQTILRDLSNKQGIKTFMDHFLLMIKKEKQKMVMDKLKEAQNFMKHADNDEDKILDFNPESTLFMIWESIDLYYQLAKEVTGLMMAFRLYSYLKYPDILIEEEAKRMFMNAQSDLKTDNKLQFLEFAKKFEENRTK